MAAEPLNSDPRAESRSHGAFSNQCHFYNTLPQVTPNLRRKAGYDFWVRVCKGQWEVSENTVCPKHVHREHLTQILSGPGKVALQFQYMGGRGNQISVNLRPI